MSEAVILLSGGMDSATAAYEARETGYEIAALHTSYGQRTEGKEYDCAHWLAEELDAADFLHIETDHLAAIGGSSLTDESMAVGDASEGEEIPDTYVPFRNANLLSMAVSYAEARGAEAIYIGAHSEDFAGYPDCRPAFFEAFQGVVDTGTKPETEIGIEAPYVEYSKTEIAERGLELGVPYEHTWSCYRNEAPACGTCDSCTYRREAFERAGSEDPIAYAGD
ncbi:7-cyano-7-deazaguanine synthase QueC [Halalkalicoccus jeotgali]|uniref:7-cyano-7-deazaguanine synthase n=1 Tax=Halalkalicoccus jeotgali (strain DSM 18796 / CECT 7217 / JCM 14584 / KCTC 4019 / B3) TaxID=795797 RepID=D8J9B2_HALJB|nr:7-cyano-7-deazaguanine synthase QueC [Halalkalicoccus jeotgali]ADJ16381.1 exsB protein [Halalkalicoccus jeotgali B3]ELY37115.1 exsB protein [Halalkalicoccus jeotgali B3]